MVMANQLFFFSDLWRPDDIFERSYVHVIPTNAYHCPYIHYLFHTMTSYGLTPPYFMDHGAILHLRLLSSLKYMPKLRCPRRRSASSASTLRTATLFFAASQKAWSS